MQAAIGHLRVSTQEQGRSGLGLAAQQFEIEAFGAREGFSVKSWYQDYADRGRSGRARLTPWG
jgi:DNA invertase Pin-like site-specific DNA recombinase